MSGAPTTGDRVAGRYRLQARLGAGGAGIVWRAWDEVLDREVAVKLLRPELASDHAAVSRFLAEASAAAKLNHPNAVTVYDIGRDGERDLLVMELVEGPTLADLLEHAPLPPAAVAFLGCGVAAALGAAHARGLVHRDVKPANVLVMLDGTPKVADFGIARALGDATSRLTLPGTVMGTARYLSPEQLRDEHVDPRSDVYALGLLLSQALTAQEPFGAGTAAEIAARRLATELPAPSTLRPDVPPQLDEAVVRATRRDPAARHADGTQFAAALEASAPGSARDELVAVVRRVTARAAATRRDEPAATTALAPEVSHQRGAIDVDRPHRGAEVSLPHTTAIPSPRPAPAGGSGVRSPAPAAAGGPGPTTAMPPTSVRAAQPRVTPPPRGTAEPRVAPRGRATPPPARRPTRNTSAAGGLRRSAQPARPPSRATSAGERAVRRARMRRRRLATTLLVVAALVAGVWWFTDADRSPLLDREPVVVGVVGASDHDPLGDFREYPDRVEHAVDGDPSTAWITERYDRADLIPPSKDGVGLWVELEAPLRSGTVELLFDTPGTTVELYAGTSVPAEDTDPRDWGVVVARAEDAGERWVADVEDVDAAVLVVWFTHLAPADDGYRASIRDITIRSR